jgi:hypothetical protein
MARQSYKNDNRKSGFRKPTKKHPTWVLFSSEYGTQPVCYFRDRIMRVMNRGFALSVKVRAHD